MIVLKDENGQAAVVDEGESSNVRFRLRAAGAPLVKSAIKSLRASIYDWATKQVIGGWLDTDIFDANGGTIDDDGWVILRLQKDVHVIVDSSIEPGKREAHRIRIEYTWADGVVEEDRDGMEELQYAVEKRAELILPTTTEEP